MGTPAPSSPFSRSPFSVALLGWSPTHLSLPLLTFLCPPSFLPQSGLLLCSSLCSLSSVLSEGAELPRDVPAAGNDKQNCRRCCRFPCVWVAIHFVAVCEGLVAANGPSLPPPAMAPLVSSEDGGGRPRPLLLSPSLSLPLQSVLGRGGGEAEEWLSSSPTHTRTRVHSHTLTASQLWEGIGELCFGP